MALSSSEMAHKRRTVHEARENSLAAIFCAHNSPPSCPVDDAEAELVLSHRGLVRDGSTMHLCRHDFIPAGCLGVAPIQTGMDAETWESGAFGAWRTIRHGQFLGRNGENPADEHHLPAAMQEQLVNSEPFCLVAKLLRSFWVDLEFRVSSDASSGTLRVYLLPDDAHQGLVDRSSASLRKARRRLLDSLDYSESAWAGRSIVSVGEKSPFARHDCGAEEDKESLLRVFNNIPSPAPDPDLVSDPCHRGAMAAIMSGDVAGLVSELYAYQRESAAFMVQKEAEPGTVLDPRLVAINAQDGSSPWYADPVLGTVLKTPRYYEGIAGGILAEEMGSGKTVICLALILATRALPTRPPEAHRLAGVPTRRRLGSLADMAASCATRNSIPWRCYLETWKRELGLDFARCEHALWRNPGYCLRPGPRGPRRRRSCRRPAREPPSAKIYLSSATMIVVPNNLVSQWRQEMAKHTTGLDVCFLAGRRDGIPCLEKLLELDILFFSQSRFEWLVRHEGGVGESALSAVHFKRCIVDEGHRLGNSKMNRQTDLVSGLDGLSFSSRWIVTGTPSHGLFGVDDRGAGGDATAIEESHAPPHEPKASRGETSAAMEKKDLERLGSMTALYLKAKPWANTTRLLPSDDDARADWARYLLLPRHNKSSHGSWTCLKATLNSLVVRHRRSEVRSLLPPVTERVVMLEGSYQDKLSLNLFAMMIIFNSVQSQRTDRDYFFHPRQRRSLLQMVHNLKQSSFFGASFFTADEIAKAVETADEFVQQGKVPVGADDGQLLLQAIRFGRLATGDKLRDLSNRFHEMPILVRGGGLGDAGRAWSLDGEGGDALCTSASLMLRLQRLLAEASRRRHDAASLNALLNGGLSREGSLEKDRMAAARPHEDRPGRAPGPGRRGGGRAVVLAGNTRLGQDMRRSACRPPAEPWPVESVPACLGQTSLVSTVSAKLSYLVDSVLRYHEREKVIVFYENEHVAWYLASMLDMLQVQHLIYAKSLTSERKAQYVDAFHHDDAFRVLLMDLSQAAFGLDMRAGSRVYFISPVLNPQVEAQAIGRVRRLSQPKPVSVETLVLKDSIDEVILERKRHMTQAEHGRVKSLLDVRPIYNWIKGARMIDMPAIDGGVASHMAGLQAPRPILGGGFGREHPEGELDASPVPPTPVPARSEKTVSAEEEPRSVICEKRTSGAVVSSGDVGARVAKRQDERQGQPRRAKRLRLV
ncbi:hypothetical protein E4U53_000090 [Claviceps sorghi]|nr:hypothetical protein E4U53_000090 [Claviceps sorghi]